MIIHLDLYLYYLNTLIKNCTSQASGKGQDFVKLLQVLNDSRGGKKNQNNQLKIYLDELFTCDYQPYVFAIDSLETAKFAIIYYLILQILNSL